MSWQPPFPLRLGASVVVCLLRSPSQPARVIQLLSSPSQPARVVRLLRRPSQPARVMRLLRSPSQRARAGAGGIILRGHFMAFVLVL